jgi:Transposase
MFVGWDWASTTHDVTVNDNDGRILDRWAAEHTETGLDQTLARLACHGRPAQLPVAIERSSGLVVDRLLAARHPVIPIHPNAFHATRPRWGAAGAKSDPGDSYKLAEDLRTDGHRLRRLRPLDAATRHLQALARGARRPRGRQDRGQQPAHAVRILARAWLRVIWACWHHNTVYDPAKHGAEQRLAA